MAYSWNQKKFLRVVAVWSSVFTLLLLLLVIIPKPPFLLPLPPHSELNEYFWFVIGDSWTGPAFIAALYLTLLLISTCLINIYTVLSNPSLLLLIPWLLLIFPLISLTLLLLCYITLGVPPTANLSLMLLFNLLLLILLSGLFFIVAAEIHLGPKRGKEEVGYYTLAL